jgi:hypothetical protein
MPKGARRCNDCTSYQSWRKHLQFWAAFLLAISTIFGLISGGWSGWTYILDRHSNTNFKVSGSSETCVYLGVWNSGRKPSTLTDFRLIVDNHPGKEFALELSDRDQPAGKNVIPAGGSITVGLSPALTKTLPVWRRSMQFTDDEQANLFNNPHWVDRMFTLQVDIEESDDPCTFFCDPPRSHRTRTERFPAGRISRFIRKTMGGT